MAKLSLEDMDLALPGLNFTPNANRILRDCINALTGLSEYSELGYRKGRRVLELLGREKGREQNGIGGITPETPEQREFIANIRRGLEGLALRINKEISLPALERVNRMNSYPPTVRAKAAVKMLGVMGAMFYGGLSLIAGLKKGEPINGGTIASALAYFGLRYGWGPQKKYTETLVRTLRGFNLDNPKGLKVVEALAKLSPGKLKTLQDLKREGKLDGSSLASAGISLDDPEVIGVLSGLSAEKLQQLGSLSKFVYSGGQSTELSRRLGQAPGVPSEPASTSVS